MCGISGLVSAGDGRASVDLVEALRRMTDAQSHRGPDDSGYFVEHPCYLGHRRLSIIDVGGGRQPMYNEDGSLVVLLNGEIYNYPALRDHLLARGHVLRTRSDTEVLVHLYEEAGEEFLAQVSGMFALALWDRPRKRLLLARDRMGQKPLHWAFDGSTFSFASELRSLTRGPQKRWALDPMGVARFLLHDATPAPGTVLEGARKLGPGERLVFDAERRRVEVTPYWDVPYGPEHDLTDEATALKEFERVLVPAVERHLLSDVPLGVFLSGGLDSTVVLHAMARVKPVGQIATYAVGFEDPSFDESSHAAAVARSVGTRHSEERLTPEVMLDLVPRVTSLMDEPLGDPSFVPTYLLSRFARREVTVALGGDGGDELFLGYPTFKAHGYARLASRLVPAPLARLGLALAHRLVPVSPSNISLDYQLKRFLKGLQFGPWERHFVWIGAHAPDEQAGLFRPAVLAPEALSQGVFADVHRHAAAFKGRDELDLASYLYAKLYLQDVVLVKVDRASMAVSLEVRAPFLDPEVVAFACRLHPSLKLRGRTTKYLMRRYLDGKVPAGIAARPKKGFGIPLSAWFRGPLRPFLEKSLSMDRVESTGLFRPEAVQALVREHLDGERDHRKILWNLVVLLGWMEREGL
jgi:asparagine synthase (glutamine-hydrolysing)